MFSLEGILLNCMKAHSVEVPPGAVAFLKDQFCAHPSCMQYEYVLFDGRALLFQLGRYADTQNYSVNLHDELRKVKEYFQNA